MGGISGVFLAKCKECKCVFVWHLRDVPFVDSEVTGTCSDCLNKVKHKCTDESVRLNIFD